MYGAGKCHALCKNTTVNGGVVVQNMAVANSVNLAAEVAFFIFVLMEPECKCALRIFLLHFLDCKGNAEKSSEEVMDILFPPIYINYRLAHVC